MRGFISTVIAISLVGIGFIAGIYYAAYASKPHNSSAQSIVHMAHTSHKVRYLELLKQQELEKLQEALRLHVACEFAAQADLLEKGATASNALAGGAAFSRFQALTDDITCPAGLRLEHQASLASPR